MFSKRFFIGDTFRPSMAFAAPMFPSSKETTNYARLCRLLVGAGSQVLRETFDKIHPSGVTGIRSMESYVMIHVMMS